MARKNTNARNRFAQRLRAIRIPRGYKTARSFAEALGIDENRYTRYERAEVEPDLQLFMKICGLLGATPNDLLCDTIGTPPVDIDVEGAYGFAEAGGPSYQAAPVARPHTSVSPGPSPASFGQVTREQGSLEQTRKAAAWQLAEVIAEVEARGDGVDAAQVSTLRRLRRVGPLHARIIADEFAFISELPDRLDGIDVPPEMEDRIGRLIQELIATRGAPSNDNG